MNESKQMQIATDIVDKALHPLILIRQIDALKKDNKRLENKIKRLAFVIQQEKIDCMI